LRAPTDTNVAAHTPTRKVPPPGSLDGSAFPVPGGSYVSLTLYPTAGEATAVWVPRRNGKQDSAGELREKRAPELVDLDSARRARGEIRRSIRRNRGRYLWTLTYANATYDYETVAADAAAFLLRLRQALGHVWIVLVPEPHPGGHGWHVHAVTNRTIDYLDMRRFWPKGFVYVGDHKRRRARWVTRELAGYLSKYLTKVLAEGGLCGCQPRPKRHHRYWTPKGFDPERIVKRFRTFRAAVLWVLTHYGAWDEEWVLADFPDMPVEGYCWRFPDRCCRRILQGP
jgi:hypothetical protein